MFSILLVRLVLAWIFIYEGLGKLYGWLGGGGIEGTASYFKSLGIPFALFCAYLVGYTELLSGICFLTGVLVRVAAALIASVMLAAIFIAHRQGGFNYPLLILCVCILLMESGSGKWGTKKQSWIKRF